MSAKPIHKQSVIEMLLAGHSPKAIMAWTRCSYQTVVRIRHDLNLPPHSKGGRPRKSA